MFCIIVSDLLTQGRVPTMNKVPLLAATRHDFETAELEAPEVLVLDVLEQGVDHPAADHGDAAGPTQVMADAIEETPMEVHGVQCVELPLCVKRSGVLHVPAPTAKPSTPWCNT